LSEPAASEIDPSLSEPAASEIDPSLSEPAASEIDPSLTEPSADVIPEEVPQVTENLEQESSLNPQLEEESQEVPVPVPVPIDQEHGIENMEIHTIYFFEKAKTNDTPTQMWGIKNMSQIAPL
jgi:hypothetical protein